MDGGQFTSTGITAAANINQTGPPRSVEVRSEELLAPALLGQVFACPKLVLYGIRAPIIGPFPAWKSPIPYASEERGAK